MNAKHVSVLLDECIDNLNTDPAGTYVDGTLGMGGHSEKIAEKLTTGRLICIDRDASAIDYARERLKLFSDRITFVHANFADTVKVLDDLGIEGVNGMLFDLGVSSPQLDIPERGFSYNENAPLDMRMDPGNHTQTAAEVIANYNETDLARILRAYGDERHASRIARAIVRARAKAPIETTFQLVEIVKQAIPAADRRRGGHPARKTFQALRIEVNHELEVLEEGLRAAIRWANPGGRICVIAYHSLEDRIVKHVFSEMSQGCTCPPDLPVCVCGRVPIVDVKTKKPLVASDEELRSNPRARSALMRVAVKR